MQDKSKHTTVAPKKKTNYLTNKNLLAEIIESQKQGRMTDKLARMLQLLVARYGKKGNFVNYCVDDQTTALTKRGWLSHNEITLYDEILSYNPESGFLTWSKVLDLHVNTAYSGPMHKLDTQGMDALVSPGHKFLSFTRGLVPVEDIICNEHIILMGHSVKNDVPPQYSDSFVETVGWAVTEGHYVKNSVKKRCIKISQKEGEKSHRIRNCLKESNIPFKEHLINDKTIVSFDCTGEQITSIYNEIASDRILSTDFILSLTQEQRLLLIETMVNADGWFRPNGAMSYVQKDPEHVDAFLMLCTLSGLTTSTTLRTYGTPPSGKFPNGGTSDVLTINIYNKPKIMCKAENIDFHGGRTTPGGRREQKQNTPTVQYDGTIWCPQTEYGTFIARRGKYIYVSGNTYNSDMQAYAMLMLVKTWTSFKPERSNNPFAFFTQCVKNSFIQFLNQEKRQRDIRDTLLVSKGLSPSHTFQIEHEERLKAHREVDPHDQHLDDNDAVPIQENSDEETQF